MAIITSKFYPITDIYFRDGKPVDLMPGQSIVAIHEPMISGIHIFNWSSESWIKVETATGQIIKFPATSLVEGAVYYMKLRKLIEAGPSSGETQVMAISTSDKV
jgi:hypothetical protein